MCLNALVFVKQVLQSLLEVTYLIIKKFKRFLVLDRILYAVVLVFLIGFLRHQFLDEIGELGFDGGGALVVELVVAEVDQKSGQVIVFVADSQSQVLGDGLGHIVGVDADGILGRQPQVMGETSREFLHECVDGAHAKTAVIVDDTSHQALRVAFQFLVADAEFVNQDGFHRVRVDSLAIDDFAQCVDDFRLHLVGCGIGKSNGEDVPEIADRSLVFEAEFQVFLDEGEGLSCPRRGLVNLEVAVVFHNQLFSGFRDLGMKGWLEGTVFFLNRSRNVVNERLYDRPRPWV